MSCFHPITAWKTEAGIIFYNPYKDNRNHKGFKIPCRQCTGCRSEYSRQWAMRILHEASLNLHNSFITLTYNDAHLPGTQPDDNGNYDAVGTLKISDFQKFMKRLRKKYPNRIPVIVEKDPRSKLNDIDKNKFLVPNDMNFSQFIYVIRKRIKLLPEEALFLFVNGQIAANGSSMNNIYQTHKDKDGFIYITYTSENTFG